MNKLPKIGSKDWKWHEEDYGEDGPRRFLDVEAELGGCYEIIEECGEALVSFQSAEHEDELGTLCSGSAPVPRSAAA